MLASMPASGNSATREADRQRSAGDIDQFVRRRFEGESGGEFGPVAKNLGPARPDHGRYARHRSGEQRRQEQRPDRPVLMRGGHQRREGQDRKDRRGDDHARLADPVDQPRDLRRGQRVGQRIGRRDGARQPVFAMCLRQHGDDADRRHRHRHAGDEPGRGKTLCARCSKNLSIGIGHDLLLDMLRAAAYIRIRGV